MSVRNLLRSIEARSTVGEHVHGKQAPSKSFPKLKLRISDEKEMSSKAGACEGLLVCVCLNWYSLI